MYAFVWNIVHDFDNICWSCKCIILFHCYLIKNYCYLRIVLYRWTYRARYRPYRSIFRSISDDMFENDIYKMICYVYIGRAPKVIYRPIYRSYRPRFKSLSTNQVYLHYLITTLQNCNAFIPSQQVLIYLFALLYVSCLKKNTDRMISGDKEDSSEAETRVQHFNY